MATAKEILDYIRYNDWGVVTPPTNWYHDEQKEKLVDCVWVRKVPLVSRHVGSNLWENETSFDIYLFTKQDYLDTLYNQLLKILHYYPWRSISYYDDFEEDTGNWIVAGVQSDTQAHEGTYSFKIDSDSSYLDGLAIYGVNLISFWVFVPSTTGEFVLGIADQTLADILLGVTSKGLYIKSNGVGELQYEYYDDLMSGTPTLTVDLELSVTFDAWFQIIIDFENSEITIDSTVVSIPTIGFRTLKTGILGGSSADSVYFDDFTVRALDLVPERTHDIILNDLGQSQYDKDEKVHKFKITETTVVQR